MGPATGVVAGCVSPSDGTLCWTVRQTATTPTAAQSDGRETEEATGVRRSCGPPHHCDGCASSAAKTTPRASLRRSESEADRLLHVVQWRRQCGGKRSRGPPHQMWAIPAGTVLLTLSEASITDKTTQGTGEARKQRAADAIPQVHNTALRVRRSEACLTGRHHPPLLSEVSNTDKTTQGTEETRMQVAAEVIPQAGRWASTKIAAHTALGLRVK